MLTKAILQKSRSRRIYPAIKRGLGAAALNKLKRTGPHGAVLSVEGKMIAFYPACSGYALDSTVFPMPMATVFIYFIDYRSIAVKC